MRQNRQAFTLVEALVVLVVLSSVLATISLAMHALLQSNRNMQDAFRTCRQIARFTWQLREDAHQATAAGRRKTDGDASARVLWLRSPDSRRVEYRLSAERITRIEYQGNEVMRRESYAVSVEPGSGWHVDPRRATPLVSVLVRAPHGPLGRAPLHPDPIRIVTAVNLHGELRDSQDDRRRNKPRINADQRR